ncbi:energy-coupling factor transporter transmembrane component T, partial [Mycoplasma nasistruthionis]
MKSVFGRFIPGQGFLYRVDPRLKLITLLIYIILVFMSRFFIDLVLLTSVLVVIYISTFKRVRPLLRMVKLPLFISIIILFVNIYSIKNENVAADAFRISSLNNFYAPQISEIYNTENGFWNWITTSSIIKTGPLADMSIHKAYGFSLDSVNRSINLFFRIYTMILLTTLLTNTTRPILLTKAIEDLLYPLKILFIPTHIIAMIISLALRFIPTLIDEANRIIKAQSSRGVDFKHGNMKEKINAFSTLIIPLFVSSFSKAEDLASSMETRGYDPYMHRTKYRIMKLVWRDIFICLVLLLIITFIMVNFFYMKHLPLWYMY